MQKTQLTLNQIRKYKLGGGWFLHLACQGGSLHPWPPVSYAINDYVLDIVRLKLKYGGQFYIAYFLVKLIIIACVHQ